MATREQAMSMGATIGGSSFSDSTRSAGYVAREAAYLVEDTVLDFFYALKASFLAIPEIAMMRTGTAAGEPLGEVTLRDKIVSTIVLGASFAALVAVAVLAG